MKFSFSSQISQETNIDLLALPVFEQEELSFVDTETSQYLQSLAADEKFEAKQEQKLLVASRGLPAKRILFVGMGKRAEVQNHHWRNFAALAVKSAAKVSAQRIGLQNLPSEQLRAAAEGILLGNYQYNNHKSEAKPSTVTETFFVTEENEANLHALKEANIIASSVIFARDLVNEPAIVMTPTLLAGRAEEMAKEFSLDAKIFGPKECREQNMNLLLAVGQGSKEEVRFVHLTYKPKNADANTPRVALIGKGVTFDSGGLSLKPPKSMIGMQYDMAGSAAVIGAIRAIAQLQPNVEVHAIAPLTENMPSGTAYRPSDVVRGMSGKTVEILNTDAEGRLILADALWYAAQLQPQVMIDLATLTGACLIALGHSIAGAFSSHQVLADQILASAKKTGEDMWQLPLPEKMKADIKGDVADIKNVTGDPAGGAINGALFLQEFTNGLPWAHLDIAGPANVEKETPIAVKGGTGFGVMTLVDFVRNYTPIS